jgi:hypothetical protein
MPCGWGRSSATFWEEHSASIFRTSITSVNFYTTTWRNIQEDIIFHRHRLENIRYEYIFVYVGKIMVSAESLFNS